MPIPGSCLVTATLLAEFFDHMILLDYRDGKDPKILSSCSIRVLHRWNWKHISLMVNWLKTKVVNCF